MKLCGDTSPPLRSTRHDKGETGFGKKLFRVVIGGAGRGPSTTRFPPPAAKLPGDPGLRFAQGYGLLLCESYKPVKGISPSGFMRESGRWGVSQIHGRDEPAPDREHVQNF